MHIRHLACLVVTALFGAWSPSAEAAVTVVATTQDLASIVEEVGGDATNVTWIVRGDLDPHFIDAKPSYMVKLANADLVVAVGMELEVGWLPSLLTGARNPGVQPGTRGYLDASTAIRPIEVPTGQIDRSRGDLHPQGNPHYWLDPENGRLVARLVARRLIELDPATKPTIDANLVRFETKLTAKQAEWAQKLAPLKGTPIVGYHMTFDYLATAYGLPIVGFVEPKPGIPPTPSHTLALSSSAKSQGAKFVFVEPYHNPRDAGPIATASGAKVVVLPTSVGAVEGVTDYFGLFDRIVEILTS